MVILKEIKKKPFEGRHTAVLRNDKRGATGLRSRR